MDATFLSPPLEGPHGGVKGKPLRRDSRHGMAWQGEARQGKARGAADAAPSLLAAFPSGLVW